jgi:hypothetical protein
MAVTIEDNGVEHRIDDDTPPLWVLRHVASGHSSELTPQREEKVRRNPLQPRRSPYKTPYALLYR